MGEHENTSTRSPKGVINGRLDSWKEIAAYLGRSIRTVQRWEEQEHLPVHRLAHADRASVFAFPHELDAWRAGRSHLTEGHSDGAEVNGAPTSKAFPLNFTSAQLKRPGRARWWLFAVLAAATALAATIWLAQPLPEPRILKYDQITTDRRAKRPPLATDGTRVYFTEQTPAGWVIA
jgi:hypothetical protein